LLKPKFLSPRPLDAKYPVLIIDPHGDYLGLWQKRDLFKDTTVELFFPSIEITERNYHIVHTLIGKMTTGLSEPQRDVLEGVLEKVKPKAAKERPGVVAFIRKIIEEIWQFKGGVGENKDRHHEGKPRRNLGRVSSDGEAVALRPPREGTVCLLPQGQD